MAFKYLLHILTRTHLVCLENSILGEERWNSQKAGHIFDNVLKQWYEDSRQEEGEGREIVDISYLLLESQMSWRMVCFLLTVCAKIF